MIDGWTTTSSGTLHVGQRMSLRRDEIRRPSGTPGAYEYIELADGVRIAAIDDQHRIALVQEDVYVAGERLTMLPGGGCESFETPQQAAERELAEEAGITASRIQLLTVMWRMPGGARTREYLYLARGLSLGQHHREASEGDMTLHWVPITEAVEMCRDGRITEAGTLAAVLLAALQLTNEPDQPDTGDERN